MTTIRYFIPEDGDTESQPNIFLAPKSRQPGHPPTLGQIKQAFPLLGRYHYRFKTSIGGTNHSSNSHQNHLAVWMDCIDDSMPVPVWQSQIIAKITRIGVEEEEDDDDDDEDFRRPNHHPTASQPTTTTSSSSSANVAVGVPLSHPPPPQQPQQVRQPPQQQQAPPSFDLFGDGPSVPTTNSTTHHPPHNMSANLFDTAPVASSSHSLFDMSYQPTTTTTTNSDFLGMTTAPSPPVSGNYGGYAASSMPPQHHHPQQQQQQQRSTSNTSSFGASNSTSSGGGGAFGDLAWK